MLKLSIKFSLIHVEWVLWLTWVFFRVSTKKRNQQASPEGSANHLCEILSEIKVPWIETVIKLNVLAVSFQKTTF
jgi:hypothetical protein